MANLSKEICIRCGVAVTHLGDNRFKHCSNRHTKTCGKPPHVVSRVQYEAEMGALVNLVAKLPTSQKK